MFCFPQYLHHHIFLLRCPSLVSGNQSLILKLFCIFAGGNLTAQGATINAAAIGAKAGNDIVVTGRRTGYQYESVLNSGDVSRFMLQVGRRCRYQRDRI